MDGVMTKWPLGGRETRVHSYLFEQVEPLAIFGIKVCGKLFKLYSVSEVMF
jgi:hypothetical protein